MHHIQPIILSILLLHLAFLTNAQTAFNGWLMSVNTYKVNDKFTVYFDGQLRSSDQLRQVQTYILRPGVSYNIKKNIIATVGYASIGNRRTIVAISDLIPEHRIWEQFQVIHPVGFTALTHRFRLEQRFIMKYFATNNDLETRGNLYANRFRYFFRDIIPLNGEKTFKKGTFVALQNEVFINIGDKSVVNKKYFDQNRAYLALGYRISQEFDLEAGYLNQYVAGENKSHTNNHNIQLAAYVRL